VLFIIIIDDDLFSPFWKRWYSKEKAKNKQFKTNLYYKRREKKRAFNWWWLVW